MKKMLLVAAIAAIGTAAEAVDLTPADYVQDGLLVHFDAIDNEGTGTHNASATRWKDLKGSAYITKDSGSWSATYFDTTPTQHTLYSMPAYNRASVTMEVAINILSNGLPANATQTQCWPRIFADGEPFSVHFYNSAKDARYYMSGQNPEARANAGDFRTGTIVAFSSSDNYGLAVDGWVKAASTVPVLAALDRPARDWILNGYSGWLHGQYSAIRLYNRRLTAAEMARNAVIDKIRFWNTMPDGYRDNSGTLQQRFFVKKPTAGGTVKVDGVTLTEDFEEWATFGTATTHTLEVTAEGGYIFQGWTGDTRCIASDSFYSNSLTVAWPLATSLTPVFTATPTPAMAMPVVTITVDSGTTVLDDWLTAHPDVTIGTSGTIVKNGAGTLSVTNGIISSFAGEVVIEAGRWYATTNTGLGVKSGGGAVWVKNGATLQMHSVRLIGGNESALQFSRQVYATGTGYNGNGALIGSCSVSGSDCYHLMPVKVALLGDARISVYQKVNFNNMNVQLNRFTATVSPFDSDWVRFSGAWTNGNIIATSKPLLIEGGLNGGVESVIRFKSNSGYRANGFTGKWTAIFENNSCFYGPNKNGSSANWNGPIALEGNTYFTSQDPFGKVSLSGAISGSGNLGNNTSSSNDRFVNITLANSGNSFTGGVWLKRNSLDAKIDGAIPANGAALSSENSTVYLSAAMEYHLPDLALSGTGRVYSVANTTGSFKNATKVGGNTITWNTKVGAKSFALNGGTLKFGAQAATADFGRFSAASGTTLDLSGTSWTCTNLTGAATLVDGTLTVNGPWTLNPASVGTLGGGTATVAFGPNTVLSLANMAGLNRQTIYTIATSATAFTAPLPVDAATRAAHWRVRLSVDGRSQELFYAGGTTILFR